MMHQKALLFNDLEVAKLIMQQKSPFKQKFLGRQVRGFNLRIWENKCQTIMVDGLVSKFAQDEYSLNELINTGDREIVEASPTDKIWGIGLGIDDKNILAKSKWKGKNLLGIVLMKTRDIINEKLSEPR